MGHIVSPPFFPALFQALPPPPMELFLAVLVVGLGDETQARETLEGIIQQALSGRALRNNKHNNPWC